MAVPSTGSLSMRAIAIELVGNEYNANYPSDGFSLSLIGQISLRDMQTGGNANSTGSLLSGGFDDINLANLNGNKPDNSTPYHMSEFYAYDHHPTLSTTPAFASFPSSSSSNNIITVNHSNSSTWYVSSKPSWVTITQGSTNASSPSLGTVTQCKYSVGSNSGSARSGSIVITLNVGTSTGSHPFGSNSSTTRTTSVSQSEGSGGGNGLPPGGGGRGGEP